MKYQAMLATKTDRLLTGPGWIHERKHDGERLLMEAGGTASRLYSKAGLLMDNHHHALAHAARAMSYAVLDGEVVNGVYWVFDIIELGGVPLRYLRLVDRKSVLLAYLETQAVSSHRFRYVEHCSSHMTLALLWARVSTEGWEGIVSKRADSTYVEGRSQNWKKLKPHYLPG